MTIQETIDRLQALIDLGYAKPEDTMFICKTGENGFTDILNNILVPKVIVKDKNLFTNNTALIVGGVKY